MKRIAAVTFLSLLFASQSLGSSLENWAVKDVALREHTQINRTLTFSFGRAAASVRASLEVRLTSIETYFIAGNKLVVMGEAGRTQEVVIFDLISRKVADSFFCYYPQRLSENLLAYIEYYPSNGAGNPRD